MCTDRHAINPGEPNTLIGPCKKETNPFVSLIFNIVKALSRLVESCWIGGRNCASEFTGAAVKTLLAIIKTQGFGRKSATVSGVVDLPIPPFPISLPFSAAVRVFPQPAHSIWRNVPRLGTN